MADERARRLRKNMTDAEHRLWRYFRLRRLDGHTFRRQVCIGPYIADFACLNAQIVVEVDGSQHAEAHAYDSQRNEFMRAQGFRVLRVWNSEVLENMEGVWDAIVGKFNNTEPCGVTPNPNLPPQGGKELS